MPTKRGASGSERRITPLGVLGTVRYSTPAAVSTTTTPTVGTWSVAIAVIGYGTVDGTSRSV